MTGTVRLTFVTSKSIERLFEVWSGPGKETGVVDNITFHILSREELFSCTTEEDMERINWEAGECPDLESVLESINWDKEMLTVCADVDTKNEWLGAFMMVHGIVSEELKNDAINAVTNWKLKQEMMN